MVQHTVWIISRQQHAPILGGSLRRARSAFSTLAVSKFLKSPTSASAPDWFLRFCMLIHLCGSVCDSMSLGCCIHDGIDSRNCRHARQCMAEQSAHEARDPAVWVLKPEARFPVQLLHCWGVSCGVLGSRRLRDQQASCGRGQQRSPVVLGWAVCISVICI